MKVFLGGTCNNSTWRDVLIPRLNITYFNPVVDDWTPECVEIEWKEKESSDILLYVITPQMTGTFSIAEMVDDSNKRPHKTVACFIKDWDGQSFNDGQWKSLMNTADMLVKNGAEVVMDFEMLHMVLNNFEIISSYNKENYYPVFIDTEFTDLAQDSELISIGMCDADGASLYSISSEFNRSKCNEWVKDNILPTLEKKYELSRGNMRLEINEFLRQIVPEGKKALIIADCLAYDWVLFVELMRDEQGQLPQNIFYVPVDIMAVLICRGIDIDINREKLMGMNAEDKHNALHDAEVIREIWKKYIQ